MDQLPKIGSRVLVVDRNGLCDRKWVGRLTEVSRDAKWARVRWWLWLSFWVETSDLTILEDQ